MKSASVGGVDAKQRAFLSKLRFNKSTIGLFIASELAIGTHGVSVGIGSLILCVRKLFRQITHNTGGCNRKIVAPDFFVRTDLLNSYCARCHNNARLGEVCYD